jgi:hypothetical protein
MYRARGTQQARRRAGRTSESLRNDAPEHRSRLGRQRARGSGGRRGCAGKRGGGGKAERGGELLLRGHQRHLQQRASGQVRRVEQLRRAGRRAHAGAREAAYKVILLLTGCRDDSVEVEVKGSPPASIV